MTEKTELAENKPKKLWDGALKMVKGENTTQLIEQFTSEMTLVAEGLYDDQMKLRRNVDQMMTEEDQRIQKLESRIQLLEAALDEERAAHDRDLTETRNRLASMEKKTASQSAEKKNGKDMSKRSIIRDLTWLVGIAAGAWIIVTILHMIK